MRHVCSLLAVLFAVAFVASCGSANNNTLDVCEQGCDRAVTCNALPAGSAGSCKAQCGSDVNPLSRCSNEGAIVDCQNTCLAKSDCGSYQSCLAACPACGG